MKDIIRMNQLAGIITEGQAKKMMEILNEEDGSILTQDDFDILKNKGFEINKLLYLKSIIIFLLFIETIFYFCFFGIFKT